MKGLILILSILAVWSVVSLAAGGQIVPSPVETATQMIEMLRHWDPWRHILITLFRGTAGLALALAVALLCGIPCGMSRTAMDLLAPLVFAVQGCPTILWISLLMVWVGLGSVVPIIAVFLATAPVVFLNVAQGTAALDVRLFKMARVYRVPRREMLRHIVLPGISSHLLAGFSFALGVSWKVTSTAEFIGSGSGVGAQIYWAYRLLDMPRLFVWAVILIAAGMALEMKAIRPLRRKVEDERKSVAG